MSWLKATERCSGPGNKDSGVHMKLCYSLLQVRLRGALGKPGPSQAPTSLVQRKAFPRSQEQCSAMNPLAPTTCRSHRWGGPLTWGKVRASAAQARLSSCSWATLSKSLNLSGPPGNCQNRSKQHRVHEFAARKTRARAWEGPRVRLGASLKGGRWAPPTRAALVQPSCMRANVHQAPTICKTSGHQDTSSLNPCGIPTK